MGVYAGWDRNDFGPRGSRELEQPPESRLAFGLFGADGPSEATPSLQSDSYNLYSSFIFFISIAFWKSRAFRRWGVTLSQIAISNTLPCSVRSRASRPLYAVCVIFDAYALFESRPIPNRTRIGPLPTFVSKFLPCLIFEPDTRLVLVFPVNHFFWFLASIFI